MATGVRVLGLGLMVQQRHRNGNLERVEQKGELAVELETDLGHLGDAEAAELCAWLIDRESCVTGAVLPDQCVKRRVEHDAWVVAEHALGDGVVTHQITRACVTVAGERHDRV